MRGLSALLRRLSRRDAVSRDWLRDQDRRACTQGEDLICWQWPVRKLFNDSPIWNQAQRRKTQREAA